MKCPKSEKKQKILDKIYETLSKPFNSRESKNTINLKKYFERKYRSSLISGDEGDSPTSSNPKSKTKIKFSTTFH